MNKNKLKKGQILVFVLIALMVVGIVVVSITTTVLRDAMESQYNVEYDNYYAKSEAFVKYFAEENELIDVNAEDIEKNLESILTELVDEIGLEQDGQVNIETEKEIKCEKFSLTADAKKGVECSIGVLGDFETKEESKIEIADLQNLNEVRLQKDETIMWYVDSSKNFPSDEFTVSYSVPDNPSGTTKVALEVIVDFSYQEIQGDRKSTSVRGVYQEASSSVFPSLQNEIVVFNSSGKSFTFSIETIKSNIKVNNKFFGLIDKDEDINILSIRFKPYIQEANDDWIYLSVSADTYQTDVFQSRSILSTTYKISGDNKIFGARPIVKSNYSFYYVPSILDYIIRATGDVNVPDTICPNITFNECKDYCANNFSPTIYYPDGPIDGKYNCNYCISDGNEHNGNTSWCCGGGVDGNECLTPSP